jgi:lipoyl-dependent peroxiredoxin
VRMVYHTPTVPAIGGRHGRVRSTGSFIDQRAALPKEVGGPGGKTNPEELFAAESDVRLR